MEGNFKTKFKWSLHLYSISNSTFDDIIIIAMQKTIILNFVLNIRENL